MTARVVYSMNVSADGYINSPTGSIEWGNVDEEVHSWFNDRAREQSADIYGRRLYEVMAGHWPYALDDPDTSEVERDFARIWNSTPKIVFSRTLESAPSADRLLRTDVADEIDGLKAEFDGEIGVGGATIASALIRRNLVDEYRLIVHPVFLGGGTPFFPTGAQLDLQLTDTRRFGNGAVLLVYRPR
jgi:dihydrofolate reductase